MTTSSPRDVTELLHAWSRGDQAALDQLIPLVYEELRRLAKRHLAGEYRRHSLETTVLVNEAYLRLVGAHDVQWQDRAHFFAISARLMRQILVDFARSRRRLKREGAARQVTLDEALNVAEARGADLVALDDALQALAEIDPRKARIVELRFFGGLTNDEIAEVLGISPATIKREWQTAKVWLFHELKKKETG
ncbi:MAG TPA: sigma-70 family RNA polymerase sigma factor [Blastocatellia bacterium]|nr:sigma-70 family RNA polymerase sigma factor [Blastocatellia bacterium]